jgi:hypothetical protein
LAPFLTKIPSAVLFCKVLFAVKHARVSNKPMKEMLGGVEVISSRSSSSGITAMTRAKFRTSTTLGLSQPRSTQLSPLRMALASSLARPARHSNLFRLSVDEWLEALVGPEVTGLHALLRSENIGHKSGYIANPRLFSPRVGRTVTVKYDRAGAPVGVSLYGAAGSLELTNRHLKPLP